MDQIDQQIIQLLEKNSRLSNKEIGKKVHLSGQAVGNRIQHLVDTNIIKHFTIAIAHENTQYIRLFMDTPAYTALEKAVNEFPEVATFDKTSGQACYLVIAHFSTERLREFIDIISKWARYSVESTLLDKRNSHFDD